MISIKNEHELEAMRQACKITAAARALAGEMVRPGVTMFIITENLGLVNPFSPSGDIF